MAVNEFLTREKTTGDEDPVSTMLPGKNGTLADSGMPVMEGRPTDFMMEGNTSVANANTYIPPDLVSYEMDDADYTALAVSLLGYVMIKRTGMIFSSLQKLALKPRRIEKLLDRYQEKNGTQLVDDLKENLTGSDLKLALELIGMKAEADESLFNSELPADDLAYKNLATGLKALLDADSVDAAAVYAQLMPLSGRPDSVLKLKKAYTDLTSGSAKALEEALVAKLPGQAVFYALYLLNAPPPSLSNIGGEGLSWVGTENVNVDAGGGKVKQQTDVTVSREGNPETKFSDFSMEYSGGLSESSRWLQFVWRTVDFTETGDAVTLHPVAAEVNASGKTPYQLTTDTNAPVYSVDVLTGSKSPFYEESGGGAIRDDSHEVILDVPGETRDIVGAVFAKEDLKAETVIATAYFNTFLVRDFFPIVRINHTRKAVFTRKPGAKATDAFDDQFKMTETSTTEVKGSKPLPKAMKEVLVLAHPDYSYIASE